MLNLTPTEMERLTIFTVAEMARRRKARGVKLNYVEALAYITDEICEGARDGRSVAELVTWSATLLTTDDVMPGVADLMSRIMVDALFPDGTKLVTVYKPIRPGKEPIPELPNGHPGEIITPDEEIELNPGRPRVTLPVLNTGDRAIQVASHFHFFEANKMLEFDRAQAFGMRLDVPAGASVRFEPGVKKEVALVQIGGTGEVTGLNNLTNGSIRSEGVKSEALKRARDRGFKGA
ncbi:MAG: urease subunit gamma [Candidatus Binatia bacterium]